MKSKQWIRVWFIIISLILFIGLFNYIVDPNGFNRTVEIKKFNKIKAEGSTNFPIKYKMPLLRQDNWDNLMLGTSKIGVLDNSIVDKYFTGKTFNLEQPGSTIPVQLDSFRYALHYNNIKKIIYAVDFASFNENSNINEDYIQLKDKLKNFDPIYTYDIYFNLKTFKKSLKLILDNYRDTITPSAMYLKNGRRVYQNYIYDFENNKYDFQKKIDGTVKYWFQEDGNYKYSSEYMKQFNQFVIYCKEHNIELYVYISPNYQDLHYAIGSKLLNELELFKRELAKVIDYVDFTGINKITTNKEYYWDAMHLKLNVTDVIMRDVIDISKKKLHNGILVNTKNIEEHLRKQRSEYKNHD